MPHMFGKTHFDLEKKSADVYIQELNGRVWHVRYVIRMRRNWKNPEILK